jgi:hypothetical protein
MRALVDAIAWNAYEMGRRVETLNQQNIDLMATVATLNEKMHAVETCGIETTD